MLCTRRPSLHRKAWLHKKSLTRDIPELSKLKNMKLRWFTRLAVAVVGLAVIAEAFWWAAQLPAQACTYHGDWRGCDPGNPTKVVIVATGIVVGGGLLLWASQREHRSHWEGRAPRR